MFPFELDPFQDGERQMVLRATSHENVFIPLKFNISPSIYMFSSSFTFVHIVFQVITIFISINSLRVFKIIGKQLQVKYPPNKGTLSKKISTEGNSGSAEELDHRSSR